MSGLKGQSPGLAALALVAGITIFVTYLLSTIGWASFVVSVNNNIDLMIGIDDRGTKTLAFLLAREGNLTAAEEIGNLRAGREAGEFVKKAAEALRIKVEVLDEKNKLLKKYGEAPSDSVETTIAFPGLKKGRISVG